MMNRLKWWTGEIGRVQRGGASVFGTNLTGEGRLGNITLRLKRAWENGLYEQGVLPA